MVFSPVSLLHTQQISFQEHFAIYQTLHENFAKTLLLLLFIQRFILIQNDGSLKKKIEHSSFSSFIHFFYFYSSCRSPPERIDEQQISINYKETTTFRCSASYPSPLLKYCPQLIPIFSYFFLHFPTYVLRGTCKINCCINDQRLVPRTTIPPPHCNTITAHNKSPLLEEVARGEGVGGRGPRWKCFSDGSHGGRWQQFNVSLLADKVQFKPSTQALLPLMHYCQTFRLLLARGGGRREWRGGGAASTARLRENNYEYVRINCFANWHCVCSRGGSSPDNGVFCHRATRRRLIRI